jgi:parvulin-like peptidyl-prolyl isomerase
LNKAQKYAFKRSGYLIARQSKITMENNLEEKNKKIKISTVVYSAAIIFLALLVISWLLLYFRGTDNNLTRFFSRLVPFPVAIVDRKEIVSFSELAENLDSVKKFYENQDFSQVGLRVDFTTKDGKKRLEIKKKDLLNKMIEDKAIKILAKENGIKVSRELGDESFRRKLDEYGTEEELKKKLTNLYNWDIETFKEKIVQPSLLNDELQKKVTGDNSENFSQPAKDKAKKALALLENGDSFEDVAKKYSDGTSAGEGGDLGWFEENQLLPEVAKEAFALGIGERSAIIESALGFHIIKVEEKKKENNQNLVKMKQIFTRKKTYFDWLDEGIKEMNVIIVSKDWRWNKEKGLVEFKNKEMKDFEKEILERIQEDT